MGGKKKKQAFEEEELKPKTPQILDLMDKSDMDKTQYLCFMPEDAIYSQNTSLLKDNIHFQAVMRELLKQLNWLRYLSFKQFWATVQFNLSLKYCLESCLMFFQRKKYSQYIHEEQQSQQHHDQDQPRDKLPKNDEIIQYQKHIYQMLLIAYLRIIQSEDENPQLSKQFKCSQSVYDNWIIDIPKLFNIMDIYGQSNPQITKLIVEKAFAAHSDYTLDFIDVLFIMSKQIFPNISQEFKFLHDRSEFQKQINQDTFEKKMRHFIIIKDLTSTFLNIFKFFPFQVHIHVITSHVLTPLENLYYEIYSAYKNWQFHQYTEKVHSLMDSIEEDLIEVWRNIFKTFRKVILQETNMRYIKDFSDIKEIAIQNINRLGEEFGTVVSQGKKGKQKRNYMLLEQLMESFDFQSFFNQLIELDNKNINKQKINELHNVVTKLTELKYKRLHPEKQYEVELEDQQLEDIKHQDVVSESPKQPESVRKQSIRSVEKVQKRPSKQQVPSRMQKVRKPKRVQKTNERQYDDEYDDFHDYNRKIEQNFEKDSDSEIQQIPQNPNRFPRNAKNPKQLESKTSIGGKNQQKNYKYSQKNSKEYQKPERPHYKQTNRGDDNSKRGSRHGDHRPSKKQYRQK